MKTQIKRKVITLMMAVAITAGTVFSPLSAFALYYYDEMYYFGEYDTEMKYALEDKRENGRTIRAGEMRIRELTSGRTRTERGDEPIIEKRGNAVPVRFFADCLGLTIHWDDDGRTQYVTVQDAEHSLEFQVNSTRYREDGKRLEKNAKVRTRTIDGKVYADARAILDSFDIVNYIYDGEIIIRGQQNQLERGNAVYFKETSRKKLEIFNGDETFSIASYDRNARVYYDGKTREGAYYKTFYAGDEIILPENIIATVDADAYEVYGEERLYGRMAIFAPKTVIEIDRNVRNSVTLDFYVVGDSTTVPKDNAYYRDELHEGWIERVRSSSGRPSYPVYTRPPYTPPVYTPRPTPTPSNPPIYTNDTVDVWTMYADYSKIGKAQLTTSQDGTVDIIHIWGIPKGTTITFDIGFVNIADSFGQFAMSGQNSYGSIVTIENNAQIKFYSTRK